MISVGSQASVSFEVDQAATARALGSGDLDVLGTPKVVSLMEAAAVAAIGADLAPTETSVGIHVAVDHVAAVGVGSHVVATAVVTSVDGTRIRFELEARRGEMTIATGDHTRVVVDRRRFLDRLD